MLLTVKPSLGDSIENLIRVADVLHVCPLSLMGRYKRGRFAAVNEKQLRGLFSSAMQVPL